MCLCWPRPTQRPKRGQLWCRLLGYRQYDITNKGGKNGMTRKGLKDTKLFNIVISHH